MSPSVAVAELRLGILGRPLEQETRDRSTIVARHEGDDWPPPGWLAHTAEGGDGRREAPGY